MEVNYKELTALFALKFKGFLKPILMLFQVRRRFGGSTGSLSSASPVSEQDPRPQGSTGDLVYSPEIARMESPREGSHYLLSTVEAA